MTERTSRRPSRARVAPLALVVLLGAAVFLRPGDDAGALLLANPDRTRVAELQAAIGALPDGPLVLVGLDADMGTYPEIRVAVRAALADLLARDARLAFVSFTPEGRAIASAELDRLRRDGVGDDELLDLGFIAGAEAGMVRAVTDLLPAGVEGLLADAIRAADGGMSAFAFVLVVGGGELGPRTWVEQVGTRLPSLPMAAIVPTFAQPELAPYLRTGQLVALLATLRDGAAYAAEVGGGQAAPERVPSALAMLLGMLVALGALGRTVAAGLRGVTPGPSDGAGAPSRRRGDGSATDGDVPTQAGRTDLEASTDAEAARDANAATGPDAASDVEAATQNHDEPDGTDETEGDAR
jgi:hypothetical protein